MKERLPGKYILLLLLISFCFKTFGSVIGYYYPASEERDCLPILPIPIEKVGPKALFKFSIGVFPLAFANNASLDLMRFYSSFIWPYHFFYSVVSPHPRAFWITRTHEREYRLLGVSSTIEIHYGYIMYEIPFWIEHKIWPWIKYFFPMLSPAVSYSFYQGSIIATSCCVSLDSREKLLAQFGILPHSPFEESAIILTVVSTHLITYAGFRTIYFSLKTLLRRMSLSDLKREVKKRYLLALRESKYLISWAILLLVIAALLEGLAPIYNYLGLKYYPWVAILKHSVAMSILLWIIYLYHKRMRFSTPWEEMRRLLRAK